MINRDLPVTIDSTALTVICERYNVERLALFGSVLRDDFTPESDIDVLVEFDPESHIGWEIVTLADELSTTFGRKVDLRTPMELSRHFRKHVLIAAVVYARAR